MRSPSPRTHLHHRPRPVHHSRRPLQQRRVMKKCRQRKSDRSGEGQLRLVALSSFRNAVLCNCRGPPCADYSSRYACSSCRPLMSPTLPFGRPAALVAAQPLPPRMGVRMDRSHGRSHDDRVAARVAARTSHGHSHECSHGCSRTSRGRSQIANVCVPHSKGCNVPLGPSLV